MAACRQFFLRKRRRENVRFGDHLLSGLPTSAIFTQPASVGFAIRTHGHSSVFAGVLPPPPSRAVARVTGWSVIVTLSLTWRLVFY